MTGCLHCHSEVNKAPLQEVGDVFPVCPWCGTMFVYSYQEAVLLPQCCECGVILSGEYEGVRFLDEDGRPDLSIGVSHGYCTSCAEATLHEFQQRRRQRLTEVV